MFACMDALVKIYPLLASVYLKKTYYILRKNTDYVKFSKLPSFKSNPPSILLRFPIG